MTQTELRQQIDDGVKFSCCCEDDNVVGVMGIQDKADVVLIRHAYVLTASQNRGAGTKLLKELTRHVREACSDRHLEGGGLGDRFLY